MLTPGRTADPPLRAARTKCISMSRDRRRQVSTPRTLLPCRSRGGEYTASPACPGSTARVPPPTPDFAGIPTLLAQEPASSYMPEVIITDSTRSTLSMSMTSSPVSGLVPPVDSVAAMTARSRQVTCTEHCRR